VIAAIILAAGASQRMGYPKALLTYRSMTFLEAVLQVTEAAAIKRKIVVLGPDGSKVLSQMNLSNADVDVITNPRPETGPLKSLQLGITRVVNHPVDGVLAWHVDRPHVKLATIQALLARFRRGDASIVVPGYEARRGHPTVFGRGVFDELLAAPEEHGARSVVRADPARVAVVPVDDPAVVEDVDTPAEYLDLLRRTDATDATPPAD
jgi:molybdenum cofactor cytidylyltransferase